MKKIIFSLILSVLAIFTMSCDEVAGLLEAVSGCMDPLAINYNVGAKADDGSCITAIPGCMDSASNNYNSNANRACAADVVSQLKNADGQYIGYDSETNATGSKGECCTANVLGCTTVGACNYNAANPANEDDGSCYFPPAGTSITCDELANAGITTQEGIDTQYSETFNDNNSDGVWSQLSGNYADAAACNSALGTWYSTYSVCMEKVSDDKNNNGKFDGKKGCTDSTQGNYDPYADISCRSAGSSGNWNDCCEPIAEGCMMQNASNYKPTANTACGADVGTPNNCCTYDSPGCLDSLAQNYNNNATQPCYGCGADGLKYGPNNQIICACCLYEESYVFTDLELNVCLDPEASNYYFDGPNADPTANLVHMDTHCEYNFQCGYKHFTAEKHAFPLLEDGTCNIEGTLPEDAGSQGMMYSDSELDYYFYEDCSAEIQYSMVEKLGNMYDYRWDYHVNDASLTQDNCFGTDPYGGERWWGAIFHPYNGEEAGYAAAEADCDATSGIWWDPETGWEFFDEMAVESDQFLPCHELGNKIDCDGREECHWEQPCSSDDEWCNQPDMCVKNDPCHPHNSPSTCNGVIDFECIWAGTEETETFIIDDPQGNPSTETYTSYYAIITTGDTLHFNDMGCYKFDSCQLIQNEDDCNWSELGCMWDNFDMADQGGGVGDDSNNPNPGTGPDFNQLQCHKEGPGGPGDPNGGEGGNFDWIWDQPDGCLKQGCMAEYTESSCEGTGIMGGGMWYTWEEYDWSDDSYTEFAECEFSTTMTPEECWEIQDDMIQNWEAPDTTGGAGMFEDEEFNMPPPDVVYWDGTNCVMEVSWWEELNYEVEIDETDGSGELCFYWDDGMYRASEKKSKAHFITPLSFHQHAENVLGRLFRNNGCDVYLTEDDCWNVDECEWDYLDEKCKTGFWVGDEGDNPPECPNGFCYEDWDMFYEDCYDINGYNQDSNEFTLEKILPRICIDDCGCDMPTGTTENSCMAQMGYFLPGICEQYYLMEQEY